MTEAEWLKAKYWMGMFQVVHTRLTTRKRRLLHGFGFFSRRRRHGDDWNESVNFAKFLREQLGNPFRPYHLEPRWLTETVVALAAGIEADRAFDRMPILADALEDAGCDDRPMLDHLRGPGPHAVGCWVLDLLLNREPELFALPPLVPTMKLGRHTPPPEGMA